MDAETPEFRSHPARAALDWTAWVLLGNQALRFSSTTNRPTYSVGCVMGNSPTASGDPISYRWPTLVGEVRPEIEGGGKYPPRRWAEPTRRRRRPQGPAARRWRWRRCR